MSAASEANRQSWNADRYAAWVTAFGPPEAEAVRIVADPERVLRRLLPYLGAISGRRFCSVQGSHGRVAVALATLGGLVEVIDFSEQNQRYAQELALAAGVKLDYVLSDIMDAERHVALHSFDCLVLELGILHYHEDLPAFFAVLQRLAAPGAVLVLNEFHPVQRKLFWPQGPRDYFEPGLIEADVPNPDPGAACLGTCHYRFWTMGEVVNAVINAGFAVTRLDEHPDWTDPAIPGSFTLLAQCQGA